jgi:hypothetical protein
MSPYPGWIAETSDQIGHPFYVNRQIDGTWDVDYIFIAF